MEKETDKVLIDFIRWLKKHFAKVKEFCEANEPTRENERKASNVAQPLYSMSNDLCEWGAHEFALEIYNELSQIFFKAGYTRKYSSTLMSIADIYLNKEAECFDLEKGKKYLAEYLTNHSVEEFRFLNRVFCGNVIQVVGEEFIQQFEK